MEASKSKSLDSLNLSEILVLCLLADYMKTNAYSINKELHGDKKLIESRKQSVKCILTDLINNPRSLKKKLQNIEVKNCKSVSNTVEVTPILRKRAAAIKCREGLAERLQKKPRNSVSSSSRSPSSSPINDITEITPVVVCKQKTVTNKRKSSEITPAAQPASKRPKKSSECITSTPSPITILTASSFKKSEIKLNNTPKNLPVEEIIDCPQTKFEYEYERMKRIQAMGADSKRKHNTRRSSGKFVAAVMKPASNMKFKERGDEPMSQREFLFNCGLIGTLKNVSS